MTKFSFLDVTEQPRELVTREQVGRLYSRYYWARAYCAERDVLEVACGAGLGLTYIREVAKSVKAGDASAEVFQAVRPTLREQFEIRKFPAERIPYPDHSFDVVLMFEALYYLNSPEDFVRECKRLLRSKGVALISTANKDLYDFTPSVLAKRYFGVVELCALFGREGFSVELFGDSSARRGGMRQRLLRPIKMAATKLGLIPRTMRGKRFLKRLIFGALVPMPGEIDAGQVPTMSFPRLAPDRPDRENRIIFCAARMP